MRQLIQAFLMVAVFTLLLGGAYPLAVTGLAQLLAPHLANGGLIEKDGRVVGAEIVGQPFADPRYLHPRPSAAGAGYDAANSSGSNLAPSSAKLVADVTARAAAWSAEAEGRKAPIDLVTASASGLDPHISPAAAYLQVVRIAKARGLREEDVRAVIQANLEDRTFGLFGERRVNVLKVNLALDALPPR
ncbi:MAG: potassium-transporting ATPase subunit KdpC [Hyphomicrobiales bacterium]|nr:potassium-transporting ATPase subunit KdpC [Hyphomicrobiales bacterium]